MAGITKIRQQIRNLVTTAQRFLIGESDYKQDNDNQLQPGEFGLNVVDGSLQIAINGQVFEVPAMLMGAAENGKVPKWDDAAKKYIPTTGVGGDFANGGDNAGDARSLGNLDNESLSFIVDDKVIITLATNGIAFFGADGNALSGIGILDTDGNLKTQFDGNGGANTISGNLRILEGQFSAAVKDLTDAATIATDCNDGNVFRVLTQSDRTLGNPTGLIHGTKYRWHMENGGGSVTAFGSKFQFGDDGQPVWNTTFGKVNLLFGVYDETQDEIFCWGRTGYSS